MHETLHKCEFLDLNENAYFECMQFDFFPLFFLKNTYMTE